MCAPICAGRFLGMVKVRPQRGVASGGQRRSIGAAESRTELTAGSERARAQQSGRWRSRSTGRGASAPPDRRSCARSFTRARAAHAARWRDRVSFSLCWFMAMSIRAGMANAYETDEMCTFDVFVSFLDIRCG